MTVPKSWVAIKLTGIRWLAPTPAERLREGRVGEERVFGYELPGPRMLVWATEAAIRTALSASPVGARAILTNEARAAHVPLPDLLPALSGHNHEAQLNSTQLVLDENGEPQPDPNRKVGWSKGDQGVEDAPLGTTL